MTIHETDGLLTRRRYWELYREAIESFVKAVDKNENGIIIHALERVIKIRERDLDQAIEDAPQKAA